MEETVYRRLVDDVFRRVDQAFEAIDPDLAESQYSQGTLTIIFRETLRFILSPQAPTRQIWVAFRDRAWHFSLDAAKATWLDDRGLGVDLFALVEDTTASMTGQVVTVSRA